MKGRSAWFKRDVRRQWECPVCGKRVKTPGSVVTRACDCLAKGDPPQIVWMRLCEPSPVRSAMADSEESRDQAP
jgi:hypothetical protein